MYVLLKVNRLLLHMTGMSVLHSNFVSLYCKNLYNICKPTRRSLTDLPDEIAIVNFYFQEFIF